MAHFRLTRHHLPWLAVPAVGVMLFSIFRGEHQDAGIPAAVRVAPKMKPLESGLRPGAIDSRKLSKEVVIQNNRNRFFNRIAEEIALYQSQLATLRRRIPPDPDVWAVSVFLGDVTLHELIGQSGVFERLSAGNIVLLLERAASASERETLLMQWEKLEPANRARDVYRLLASPGTGAPDGKWLDAPGNVAAISGTAACNYHQNAKADSVIRVLHDQLNAPLGLSLSAARLFGGDPFSTQLANVSRMLGDPDGMLSRQLIGDSQALDRLSSILADLTERYPLTDTGYSIAISVQLSLLKLGIQNRSVTPEELMAFQQSVHDAIPARAMVASFPELIHQMDDGDNRAFHEAWGRGNDAALAWIREHKPDMMSGLSTFADPEHLQEAYRTRHPLVKLRVVDDSP